MKANFRKADSLRLSMARHQVGSPFDDSFEAICKKRAFFKTRLKDPFAQTLIKMTRLLFHGRTPPPPPPAIMTIFRGLTITKHSPLWRPNIMNINTINSPQIHPYEAKLPTT